MIEKKIAIMQPYFFPYIGYFQLINCVDVFVLYDEIQYSKKGWINRNRILLNEKPEYISLPLKSDSDYLNIDARFLSSTWPKDKIKILNKLKQSYRKAPYYDQVMPLIEGILEFSNYNLFIFIFNSIKQICNYLEISTSLVVSSSIKFDNNLKSQDKVLAICNSLNATKYINPEGGLLLYSKTAFFENNIDLFFMKSKDIKYLQYDNEFISFLSIVDVMMFNKKQSVIQKLDEYILF